ncbi:MAG: recombinase family protein [Gaiellales bacterium]
MAGKRTTTAREARSVPGSPSAIAYLRVSTALQAEHGMGLAAQRAKVEEYAAEHGLALAELVEEAASGGIADGEVFSHEHRPKLSALLERASRGEFSVLLVARLDRLSRDHATCVFLERSFRRYGVEVVSASEANGEGAYNDFVRGILAQVAELERGLIRERLQAGRAAKARQGRHVHGRVPYGYRSERGRLSPNQETAPVVRRIFDEARDGRTPGRIARALTRDGIPAPQGGEQWHEQSVRLILENVAYAGERHGVKRAHPAIISRRRFNEVQRALEARARR